VKEIPKFCQSVPSLSTVGVTGLSERTLTESCFQKTEDENSNLKRRFLELAGRAHTEEGLQQTDDGQSDSESHFLEKTQQQEELMTPDDGNEVIGSLLYFYLLSLLTVMVVNHYSVFSCYRMSRAVEKQNGKSNGKKRKKIVCSEKRMVDKAVQTEQVLFMPSPIHKDLLDWFDCDSRENDAVENDQFNNTDNTEHFDYTGFEDSLKFPYNSYTLCSVEDEETGNSIMDDTIDFIVSEFGHYDPEQQDNQGDPCHFFDTITDVEGGQSDVYSPPRTRSRGPVRRLSNVQDRILEYEHRTRALKEYYDKK